MCPGGEGEKDESGVGDGGVGEESLEVLLGDGGEVTDEDGDGGEDGEDEGGLLLGGFVFEEGLKDA